MADGGDGRPAGAPAPGGRSGLVLARHGQTNDNIEPIRAQGFSDTPLNEMGRRQAHELADVVAADGGSRRCGPRI